MITIIVVVVVVVDGLQLLLTQFRTSRLVHDSIGVLYILETNVYGSWVDDGLMVVGGVCCRFFGATHGEQREFFEKYGTVSRVDIPSNRYSLLPIVHAGRYLQIFAKRPQRRCSSYVRKSESILMRVG